MVTAATDISANPECRVSTTEVVSTPANSLGNKEINAKQKRSKAYHVHALLFKKNCAVVSEKGANRHAKLAVGALEL